MQILEFADLSKHIIDSSYIVLRFRGLFGDILHGLSRIHDIIDNYPDNPKIIIHEYPDKKKALDAVCLFESIPNVKYYIQTKQISAGFGIGGRLIEPLTNLGIPKEHIFDMDAFRGIKSTAKPPYVGIQIPEEKVNTKAVIFRYSGYHRHCWKRNRPFSEWSQIEQMLLDKGYTVYLLGKDDTMPVTDGVVDLRNRFTILELLAFTKDAEICISVTTFIYLWQQFVCDTYILSDPVDVSALTDTWKLNDNLHILDVDKDYLSILRSKFS